MEPRAFDSLKPNPKNPRRMDRQQADALKKSLTKFGDMSGIVFNVRSGQLVGGHMRTATFDRLGGDKAVHITQRFDAPKSTGTVALGYIGYGDEFYSYREVDWDEGTELAANVAANRISGEWDLERLADVNELIRQSDADLLELTGQTDEELKRLAHLGSEPEPEEPADDNRIRFDVKLTDEQSITVEQAINEVSSRIMLGTENNADLRGNALEKICLAYLDGLNDNATS